jgi:hypothetical protein
MGSIAKCCCGCDPESPCCIEHIKVELGLSPSGEPSDYDSASMFEWDVTTDPD